MKKLIAVTAIISGILFIVVPRFVLPSCEFVGFPRMHCSDTARAEMITGAFFVLTGILTLVLKMPGVPPATAVLSVVFSVAAWVFPDKFGYCLSSTMPCNYGMVPAVRFIAALNGLIMIGALSVILKNRRKKGVS